MEVGNRTWIFFWAHEHSRQGPQVVQDCCPSWPRGLLVVECFMLMYLLVRSSFASHLGIRLVARFMFVCYALCGIGMPHRASGASCLPLFRRWHKSLGPVCVCCTTTSFASLADGVSLDVHLRVLLRSSVSTKFGLAITCCFAVAICFVLVACFVLLMRTYFVLTALSRGYCPIPAAGICFRQYCL